MTEPSYPFTIDTTGLTIGQNLDASLKVAYEIVGHLTEDLSDVDVIAECDLRHTFVSAQNNDVIVIYASFFFGLVAVRNGKAIFYVKGCKITDPDDLPMFYDLAEEGASAWKGVRGYGEHRKWFKSVFKRVTFF